MPREKEVKFNIQLDDQNMPEQIRWTATDGPQGAGEDAKSMMIALWDGEEKNTLSINLWTKDLQVDEMHTHFFQILLNLSDTYHRATQNPYVREEMQKFCMDLADKTRAWEAAERPIAPEK
jgi:gliding motility-associated protein GldC